MTTKTKPVPTRHYVGGNYTKRKPAPAVKFSTQRAIGSGYKYDPGPDVTVTYFDTGLLVALNVCPKCGFPTEQEPAFVHCRGCGRSWPVAGASLNAQRDWEWSSGLIGVEDASDDIAETGLHLDPLPLR